MGLFDQIKDVGQKAGKAVKGEYQKQQDKAAEMNELRGKKLAALSVEYLGGYAGHKKTSGLLRFFEKRIEFSSTFSKSNSFTIENTSVVDIAIEGRHDVNRRVTVTRLLAIGIFAFAVKKKNEEKEAFITIVLSDGQEAVFHNKGKSPLELKSKMASAISHAKQGIKKSASAIEHSSVADELSKLAELKKQGLITNQEFEDQKRKLLS